MIIVVSNVITALYLFAVPVSRRMPNEYEFKSFPTNYIECKKEKGKICYRSFCPESNNRDELKTIADIVDGSKNVIRKRYQIYERENDYGNKNQ